MSKKIVIIGGGPAGVEAALEARKAGADVTIISDGPIGGRAGWHSLLPSKVWLSAADNIGTFSGANELFDRRSIPGFVPETVVQRIARVKDNWNQQLETALENGSVDMLQGTASFIDENNVKVCDNEGEILRKVKADAFIVASGSVPVFPPGLKPDGKRVIAPRFASNLGNLPQTAIVIGAGPTGCESAYFFNRFGVEVTWIVDQFGILPQMHRDLGIHLGKELVHRGVHVIQGQMVDRLDRDDRVTAVLTDGAHYSAELAFVAIGRKPDWARLNLSAAGINPEAAEQIHTDEYGRVGNKGIYFVGDAAGGALIANKAMAQARIAGRHAAGKPVRPYNPDLIVQVTYTDPQVAQIGDIREREGIKSTRVSFSAALKTHIEEDNDGFLSLFYQEKDQVMRGAIAIGSHAADVLTPIAVALRFQATINQLAEIYAPHPSLSELSFIAARDM